MHAHPSRKKKEKIILTLLQNYSWCTAIVCSPYNLLIHLVNDNITSCRLLVGSGIKFIFGY